MENNKLDPKINEPDLSDFDNSLKEIEQSFNNQISEEVNTLENLETELSETTVELEPEPEIQQEPVVDNIIDDKTPKLDESILTAPSPRKNKKDASNLLKIIAAALLCAILGLLAFLFLGSTTESNNPEVPVVENTDNAQSPQVEADSEANSGVASEAEEIIQEEVAQDNEIEESDNPELATGEPTDVEVIEEESTASKEQVDSDSASIEKLDINIPDPDKILRAEIPQDDSLIKEEMDLLTDKSERLTEQEQLLDKRVDMMDELTSKKQQQIELLEQQIEQLEKSQKSLETKK